MHTLGGQGSGCAGRQSRGTESRGYGAMTQEGRGREE